MTVCRSRDNRSIAGVCGGLAEHLGWSDLRLRVIWVLGTLFSGGIPGVLLYLALWYLMPEEPLKFEPPPVQPWKYAG